ncbi:hypothetical protein OU995_11945 [Roseateles sp. SL47]|uniref:hypothetical protein n=1 Tax=Roseateles sp. SL47 TaxID=2995138 RepID=UPI00226EDDEB|nr:hypothetical protein [Roseateles sp. SL47]WAC75361.1 hypothetical protein OU995_11945 [Roseateles sp. SL47]
MSDLAQGLSAKVPLNPGQVLRVSTPGVAAVEALYGASQGATVTANSQSFGPYSVPALLRVRATSGTVSYGLERQASVQQGTDGKLYADGVEVAAGGGGGAVAVEQAASQVISAASALNFSSGLAVSAAGSKATVQLTPQAIVTPPGVTGISNYSGYRPFTSPRESAPPTVGYPRRKSLATFFSPTSVNTVINSGNIGVNSDYTDPFIGEAWNASNSSNGGAATNGQSVRINWPANSDVVVSRAVGNTYAYDVTGNNIYITLKLLSGSPPDNLRIRLYTSGQVGASSANYWQAEVLYPHGGTLKTGQYWQTFAVPAANFTAVGTPGAITGIVTAGIQISSASIGNMLVGNIFACPNLLTKAAVIIGFDDCRSDTWFAAARTMVNRGLPGVCYPGALGSVIRSSNDEFQMTIKQLKRLQDEYGWQIASQAWDTENPSDTLPEFAAKMSAMRAFYEAEGFRGGADGSYFSNVSLGSARDEVFRKSFRTMRSYTIWSAAQVSSIRAECTPTPDPYNLQAFGVDTTIHTAAHMQTLIDKAISQKGVMRFIFHGITESNATLVGLLDYLDANRATVDVMTEAQLQDRQRALAFS